MSSRPGRPAVRPYLQLPLLGVRTTQKSTGGITKASTPFAYIAAGHHQIAFGMKNMTAVESFLKETGSAPVLSL